MSLDTAAFPEDFGEEEDPDALDVALVWPVAPGVVPVAAGVVPVELAALVVAPVPGVVATMVEGTAVEFKQLVLPPD
jgi:hypothetical protein